MIHLDTIYVKFEVKVIGKSSRSQKGNKSSATVVMADGLKSRRELVTENKHQPAENPSSAKMF